MSSSEARTNELGGNTSSEDDCESESEIQLKRKYHRPIFPKQRLGILKQVFEKSQYPDVSVRKQLVQKTGLSKDQIINWFAHRRAKLRKRISSSTTGYINLVADPTVPLNHPYPYPYPHPHPQSLPDTAFFSDQVPELYSPHHTWVAHQLDDSATRPPIFGSTSSSSFPAVTYPNLWVLPPISSTTMHMASASSIYQQTIQELYSLYHTSVTHQLADSATQPPTFGSTSSSSCPAVMYPNLSVLPPVSSTTMHMASTSSTYQQTSNYQLPPIPNSRVTMVGPNSSNSISSPNELARSTLPITSVSSPQQQQQQQSSQGTSSLQLIEKLIQSLQQSPP